MFVKWEFWQQKRTRNLYKNSCRAKQFGVLGSGKCIAELSMYILADSEPLSTYYSTYQATNATQQECYEHFTC